MRSFRPIPSAMPRAWTISGEEPLGPAWRLKLRHAPFPLAGGLMGVVRAIVEVAALPGLHTLQHLPRRGAIAFQHAGDKHPWHVLAAFVELAEELLGSVLVPSTRKCD